jgi:YHS domain-containing protein
MCENHQHDPGTANAEPLTLKPLAPAAPAGSCGGPNTAAAPPAPAVQEQDDVAECPVMTGTPVNKAQAEAAGLYRDHNGQRYWFCCAACGPMWDADPDEYAAV